MSVIERKIIQFCFNLNSYSFQKVSSKSTISDPHNIARTKTQRKACDYFYLSYKKAHKML